MKETPIENLRGLLPKQPMEQRGAQKSAEEEFAPKYVELPRGQDSGGRNLRWGLLTLLIAIGLLAWALSSAGPRALMPLAICLATFITLWVIARARLLRQRNGVFLALGIVCLLGALASMVERALPRASKQRVPIADAEATAQTAPPAPPAEPEAPLLTKEFSVLPPPDSIAHVEVLQDSPVLVGRKRYLIKAGERFALEEVKANEVFFLANELRVALPVDAVRIVADKTPGASMPPPPPPTLPETPVQVTARAQLEAVRRYPALGVKDSPENQLFLEAYRELRNSGSNLLKDPEWPVHLADSLARQEGWARK